jgi:hypothetical protein
MVNGARPTSLSDRLRLIQWGAVAIGVIVDIVSSIVFAMANGFVAGWTLASRGMSQAEVAAAISERLRTTPFLIVIAIASLACTALGGHVAARKAGALEIDHGAAVGTVSLLIGLVITLVSSEKGPVILTLVTFAGAIPAGIFGGWLEQKRVS